MTKTFWVCFSLCKWWGVGEGTIAATAWVRGEKLRMRKVKREAGGGSRRISKHISNYYYLCYYHPLLLDKFLSVRDVFSK